MRKRDRMTLPMYILRRTAEHRPGAIPGYAHDRRPVAPVFAARVPAHEEAVARGQRVRARSRRKKEALVAWDRAAASEAARSRPRVSAARDAGSN